MENLKDKCVTIIDVTSGLDNVELAVQDKDNVIIALTSKLVNHTSEEVIKCLRELVGSFDDTFKLVTVGCKYDELDDSEDVDNETYFDEYNKVIRKSMLDLIKEAKEKHAKNIRVLSKDITLDEIENITFIEI